MSSAHYFFKNYDIKQVLNLLCYMTDFPHTLTSTQKITRMYRCLLRREKEWTINQNRCDPHDYHRNIQVARQKLDKLFYVPESSALFGQTLEHFEQRVRDKLDPSMLINDARQYSPINGRSFVFSDESLKLDPFGYFSGKNVGRKPGYGFLYYPDFPHESTVWHLDPPSDFDDAVEEDSYKQ